MHLLQKYNLVSLGGLLLILIISVYYLIRNFIFLYLYSIREFLEEPVDALVIINFFITIILFIIFTAIIIEILLIKKDIKSRRGEGIIIVLTFILNLIAILAIIRMQFLAMDYLPTTYNEFLGYMGFILFFNCVPFYCNLKCILFEAW